MRTPGAAHLAQAHWLSVIDTGLAVLTPSSGRPFGSPPSPDRQRPPFGYDAMSALDRMRFCGEENHSALADYAARPGDGRRNRPTQILAI